MHLSIFQFVVIYAVKGFTVVNKAEIGVFLEFSCFLHNPINVGNLISGPSASSRLKLVHLEVLSSRNAEA